jgi:hypothetical protein
VDCHTAISYLSGLTSHNANYYTLKAVGKITGRWIQRNKKVGETPQNKRCEEVLKLYVRVLKGLLEKFNIANPISTNWDPVISQL